MKSHARARLLPALSTGFSLFLSLATPLWAAPGELDTSFNVVGKVTTSLSMANDGAAAIVQQEDGKLVVVGQSNGDFAVVRYTVDGLTDPTFGFAGRTTTSITSGTDQAVGVAVQQDGKIVVAGVCNLGANSDFTLVRYNSNGTLDSSFNGTGKVTLDFDGQNDVATAVALLPNGKILVAGFVDMEPPGEGIAGLGFYYTDRDFALARFNSDGTLDTSFNGTGKVLTNIGGDTDYAHALAVQPDGKILLAGEYRLNVPLGFPSDLVVVRYTEDGALDTSFNGTGMTTANIDAYDAAYAITLQEDGKILVAGLAGYRGGLDDPSDMAIARFRADGSLDPTFNGMGTLSATLPNLNTFFHALKIQEDGKILAAGYATGSPTAGFLLARFNADGTLDTTLNGTGCVTTTIGTGADYGYALVLQDDGKAVIAGTGGNSDFALARYHLAQADIRVGGTPTGARGEDIYNVTAEGQRLPRSVRYGAPATTAYIRIQNDGPTSDSFTIRSTAGNANFRVKYFSGVTNVTSAVVSGTYSTGTLAAGAEHSLTVKIVALTPQLGKTINLSTTATSANSNTAGRDRSVITATTTK